MSQRVVDAPRILVLQGPNMNWLGRRQPELYGRTTASELDDLMRQHAEQHAYKLEIFYTNTEGVGIDRLYQAAEEGVQGIVMNPAGWSVAANSLRYCLLSIALPYIEVHIRNQYAMNVRSELADIAVGVIQGFGINSYFLALDAMLSILTDSGRKATV